MAQSWLLMGKALTALSKYKSAIEYFEAAMRSKTPKFLFL